MSEILADFVDDCEMASSVPKKPEMTNDRLWSVMDATWDMYGRCEGMCSRVEFLAALLEYACETLRPMLLDELMTREMLWVRFAFESEWLAAQPLMVFSRQRLESALLRWKQTYGM
jgi:hypothetical protein